MLRRKMQVLRATNVSQDLPPWVVGELLDLAEAINSYFGSPKEGTRRGEKNVKFNRVMECLERFDFGTFAPDELRDNDLNER